MSILIDKLEKERITNNIMKLKNRLRKINRPQGGKSRSFESISNAQKKLRKVQTTIWTKSNGTQHIQCKLTLPACYAYKKVRVVIAK